MEAARVNERGLQIFKNRYDNAGTSYEYARDHYGIKNPITKSRREEFEIARAQYLRAFRDYERQ